MGDMKTHDQMRAELIGRAANDDSFRARLTTDPRAAIKEALNVDVPDSMTVKVHEETALSAHLVLPPSAGLTEADLEGIAAGHSKKGLYTPDGEAHQHGTGDATGPVHY